MEHEHEEVEQIPWGLLADQLEDRRPLRLAPVALAVVAAIVAGVVAVNVLRRPAGTSVELPGTDAGSATTLAATPSNDSEPEAATGPLVQSATERTETAPPALYSEADLMAMVPLVSDRLVAAQAERFVADFFTVLGPGPAEAAPTPLQPVAEKDGYSWVEWTRTVAVDSVSADRFDVTVLFRTLRRESDGALVRSPVRGIVVELAVTEEGRTAVGGLPRPAQVPALVGGDVPDLVDPPPAASAAALAAVSDWGDDARTEGAVATASGWRVVVSVVDASNVRWPLLVEVAALSDPES